MVKAELTYNPYLLLTDIRFNGQPPRINSLVEKNVNDNLQNWINELPQIFHDEMNGYDFELEFSGTTRDFNELERAFKSKGVDEDQVRLFHRSILEDRDVKLQRIEDLLRWLSDNPNDNFNNEKFRKDNEVLFDGAYSFVVIQTGGSQQPTIDWTEASVEVIQDVKELKNTDLTLTPIIVILNEGNVGDLERTLKYLSNKQEVIDSQLFFVVEGSLKADAVYRVIKDLGVDRPNFIESFSDEMLKKYFEIYPETDYIQNSIKMFRISVEDVERALELEKAEGEQINSAIDEKISIIDQHIQLIREADEEVMTNSNIDKPSAFTIAKNRVDARLNDWRKKKVKSTQEEEAKKLAAELHLESINAFDEFCNSIDETVLDIRRTIDDEFLSIYSQSKCEEYRATDYVNINRRENISIPDFTQKLMEIQIQERVLKKTPGIFYLPGKSVEEDFEVQTAFYLQKWREYAMSIITPLTEQIIQNSLEDISDYYEQSKSLFHGQLQKEMTERIEEKEELATQLSSDERRFQNDCAWLADYKQQLKYIERG